MKRIVAIFLLVVGVLHATTYREYLADFHPVYEKPFVIVVTSFNNKDWYERNLDSLFGQKYAHYRIIYIDDCSQDETSRYVKEYVTTHDQWHRFTLIENHEWASQMVNHIKGVSLCQDYEIVVHMDGDDWFAADDVLELLNKIYTKWDVWLTYGQYQTWPQGDIGGSCLVPEAIVRSNSYREFGFYYSHLRTFYAWLFKKIRLKDLMFKGSFIPTAPGPDFVFMFPMMEMAGVHALSIPDVLYRWNRINCVSQHNIPVKKEMPPVESWEKYKPLPVAPSMQVVQKPETCSVFVVSNDVQECGNVKGMSNVISVSPKNAFDVLRACESEYILLITNPIIDLNLCDVQECCAALKNTGSLVFFLSIDKSSFRKCNEPINYAPFKNAVIEYRFAQLPNGMIGWQGVYEQYLYDLPELCDAFIIKKEILLEKCKSYPSFKIGFMRDIVKDILRNNREVALLYPDRKCYAA